MKTQMARRLGILGMAVMMALAVGASPAAAQAPAGTILNTNSPQYREAIGQSAAQNAINYYYNGCASDFCYNPYGYYYGGGQPYYGGQQYYYPQAQQFYYPQAQQPYYGGQQYYYPQAQQFYYPQAQQFTYTAPVASTANYGYAPFYYNGIYYSAGFAIPDSFFTAVGCNVGNYSCFYNKTR